MTRDVAASASPLQGDFPWQHTIGLLLDALEVKELVRQIHQWSPAPEVDVLYQQTQWAGISHLSPCLVRVRSGDDPVLLQFLANVEKPWGYLWVCEGSWSQLVAHVRWLTSFKLPLGDEMYLRISDPAVAHALFAEEHCPSADLFGPCREIIVASPVLGDWKRYRRSGATVLPQYANPFVASGAQWSALKAIAFSKSVASLSQHMLRFFPEYLADLTPDQRLQHVRALAQQAIDKGFSAEREVWLYANIFGFLGDSVLDQHPDIRLLLEESRLTRFERVNRAATLAAERGSR
jgi:hypothetical protein